MILLIQCMLRFVTKMPIQLKRMAKSVVAALDDLLSIPGLALTFLNNNCKKYPGVYEDLLNRFHLMKLRRQYRAFIIDDSKYNPAQLWLLTRLWAGES